MPTTISFERFSAAQSFGVELRPSEATIVQPPLFADPGWEAALDRTAFPDLHQSTDLPGGLTLRSTLVEDVRIVILHGDFPDRPAAGATEDEIDAWYDALNTVEVTGLTAGYRGPFSVGARDMVARFDTPRPASDVVGLSRADLLASDVVLELSEGHDRAITRGGDDLIRGGGGNDALASAGGADTVLGGHGGDTLQGGDGPDLLRGGAGDDLIYGEVAVSTFHLGRAESSLPLPEADANRLFGGLGNDTLVGGRDADVLRGGAGDDMIAGGTGRDLLVGGLGDDLLNGGAGADRIVLRDGIDTAYGGAGADTFVMDSSDVADFFAGTGHTIGDFDLSEGDRLLIREDGRIIADVSADLVALDSLEGGSGGFETIFHTFGNDEMG